MTLFLIIIGVLILQRLSELVVSKRNIDWAMKEGGVEYGANHYWMFVVMHSLWFATMILEVVAFNAQQPHSWLWFAAFALLAQALRYWALFTLGKRWNTRVVVIPNGGIIASGPYKYVRHPNYIAVVFEFIAIPAMFGAWYTVVLFSILNAAVLLLVRIPAEEKALERSTGGGT